MRLKTTLFASAKRRICRPRLALICFFAGLLLISLSNVRAALLAYEPFTNATGTTVIGSGDGLGFNGVWQSNNSQGTATNTGYGLSYTDSANNALVTVGGAGFFQGLTSANNNMQPIRLFNFSRGTNGVDGTTTWISFLIARQGPTGTLSGNPYGRGANVPHDLNTGALQKLAIGNGSGATSNTVALIPQGSGANIKGATNIFGGVTNFVVVRIDHVAGIANDNAYLFVNPPLNAEPDIAAAGATSLNAFDFSFDRLRVFAGGQSSAAQPYAEMIVDEYRIGETYADVAPFSTNSNPPVAGSLLITNVHLIPGNVVLSGTGGSNNAAYHLLASSALAIPSFSWSAVATNTFDANGNFILTNPIQPGAGEKFFRLKIPAPPGPIAPSIITPPSSQTVTQGYNAPFNVSADGTLPLAYQWFFNTNTALSGATGATLTITNAQTTNAGAYTVRISNIAGSVTSAVATLTVLVPPGITMQPQSQTVLVGSNTAFNVTAAGTAPLGYQWYYNTNTALANATNATYAINAATTNQAGAYSVVVTNAIGAITSSIVTLTVNVPSTNLPNFSLFGFGAPSTGGGNLPDTDPGYRKVYTPGDFRLALGNNAVKVIEIMNDLNLGWNEIGATNQTGRFRSSDVPSLHPVLLTSGVTTIDIQDKNGLTIFSTNGATIRHAEFNVKRDHNVLIRNLKFDELWEWDESSEGDYDDKDWDFITIGDSGNCTNVWIDHCTFTRSYDGTVDMKGGNNSVTISWCRFIGDAGGPNSFVRQQFLYLETNGVPEAMFDFLRSNGFSIEDMVTIARSQKKGHLAGQSDFGAGNIDLKLTLHHNYYESHQDRLPRLRGGNAHVYNVHLNNTAALAAKALRNARVAAIPGGLGSYSFDVTLNASISTEDGAVLVEKCHYVDVTNPLRNNQTNPSNPAYTGKIRAEDTIYTLNSSTFRGSTEDPGSPLVPVPATVKPFSWTGFVTLPYSYTPDDPATIASTIATYSGAGVINWSKTNWFNTTY